MSELHKYNAQVTETTMVWNKWSALPYLQEELQEDTLLANDSAITAEPVYEITLPASALERLERNLEEYRQWREYFRRNPGAWTEYDKWTLWNTLKT